MIAYILYCVVVPPAASTADDDRTAADFVGLPVAFAVSVWSTAMTALYNPSVAAPVEVDCCVFICLCPLLLSQCF